MNSASIGGGMPNNKMQVKNVPGNYITINEWNNRGDPYTTFWEFAKGLGATGVDFDYEEFWHGDSFNSLVKTGTKGPFKYGTQTTNKIKAIIGMLKQGCKNNALKLSTPAGCVNCVSKGDWWGGNMKGI
jgi:hypothetical protein